MTNKTTIIANLVKAGHLTADQATELQKPTPFELKPNTFQIKKHSDDIKAKMTDPTKIYPEYHLEAHIQVDVSNLTQQPDGTYNVTLSGGVFKPTKEMPDFVIKSGTIMQRELSQKQAEARKAAAAKPEPTPKEDELLPF
jgi:hypothetical protein